MSAVVIVHTDPRSTIALLEGAGFHVHVAGTIDELGLNAGPMVRYAADVTTLSGGNRACPFTVDTRATPRTVLIVTPAAERAA